MRRFQLVFAALFGFIMITTSLYAAPIGIPGATAGANKSSIGPEINVLFDRDIAGGGKVESTQAFAKGEVGLSDRVDLNVRIGFGDFEIKDRPGRINTDTGPALGMGVKVTWAAIPNADLKIGSVLQTTRLRAKDGDSRYALSEYDAAIGGYFDPRGARTPRAGEAILAPYGGIVWSGVDIGGVATEKETFGIFLGLMARIRGNFHVGIELRIPEQTALGIQAGFDF